MSDLLTLLARRVDANARAEVSAYLREFPEYRTEAARPNGRAEIMDIAVWMRRRTIECVRDDLPLVDEDLTFIAGIGEKRAKQGFSTATARQVLVLHTNLMLREVHDVTVHNHLDELLRLTAWFGAQGAHGTAAYQRGYLDEQLHCQSALRRLGMLARMLVANDPAAPSLASSLGMCVAERYLVAVIRLPNQPFGSGEGAGDELAESVSQQHCLPVTVYPPNELVLLIPGDSTTPAVRDDRSLPVVRDVVTVVGRPCQVGTASASVTRLTHALEMARRVAAVAPVEKVPSRLTCLADVFVELSVAQVPEVDQSLRALARRLAQGPDLVTTLDAYYRNNMSRIGTATALHIHPRTLDYRLQRVRDLIEVDPTSVRGVRILSTAVARALSGAWS
jgi:hypothetical protein